MDVEPTDREEGGLNALQGDISPHKDQLPDTGKRRSGARLLERVDSRSRIEVNRGRGSQSSSCSVQVLHETGLSCFPAHVRVTPSPLASHLAHPSPSLEFPGCMNAGKIGPRSLIRPGSAEGRTHLRNLSAKFEEKNQAPSSTHSFLSTTWGQVRTPGPTGTTPGPTFLSTSWEVAGEEKKAAKHEKNWDHEARTKC